MGSIPAVFIIEAKILVVDVLPWVPAIAIPTLNLINSASISALGIIGIFSFFAATNSQLFFDMADEVTITSA